MPRRVITCRIAVGLALAAALGVPSGAASAAPQNIIINQRPAGQDFQRRQREMEFRQRRAATIRLPEELPWTETKLAGVTPRPAAVKALAELDSPKFEVREAASRKLLTSEVSDEEVYIMLTRNDLSTEQRARLLDAGQRRIMDAPRGALGIQMADRMGDADGVNVTGIVRGMPAEGVLRAGDRIVQINEEITATSDDLVHIVQNMRPGERVRLVVMRGERDEKGRVKADAEGHLLEKRVEVEMPLGSAQDLERMGDSRLVMRPMDGTREMLSLQLRRSFPQLPVPLKVERRSDEPLDPDTHPDIAYAREMLARPRDATLDAGIRGMLQARLSQLEAAARAPSLTPQERAWMDSVVARFRQLMAEREPRLVVPPRESQPVQPPAPPGRN